MKTFYREHTALEHVTTTDFRKILEEKTGKNCAKFFEAYFYLRKVPVLHWYFGYYEHEQRNGIKTKVPFAMVKWMNAPEGFFPCLLSLSIK